MKSIQVFFKLHRKTKFKDINLQENYSCNQSKRFLFSHQKNKLKKVQMPNQTKPLAVDIFWNL